MSRESLGGCDSGALLFYYGLYENWKKTEAENYLESYKGFLFCLIWGSDWLAMIIFFDCFCTNRVYSIYALYNGV